MLLCNVGVLKTVQCFAVRQQWLVAGWLGPNVAVRVKVRATAREWCFFLSQTSWGVGQGHRVSQISWVIRGYSVTFEGNTGQPSPILIHS